MHSVCTHVQYLRKVKMKRIKFVCLQVLLIGLLPVISTFESLNHQDTTLFLGEADHDEHSEAMRAPMSMRQSYKFGQSENLYDVKSEGIGETSELGAIYLGEHIFRDDVPLAFPDSGVTSSNSGSKKSATSSFPKPDLPVEKHGQNEPISPTVYLGEHFTEHKKHLLVPGSEILTDSTVSAQNQALFSKFDHRMIPDSRLSSINASIPTWRAGVSSQTTTLDSQRLAVADAQISNTYTTSWKKDFPDQATSSSSDYGAKFTESAASTGFYSEPNPEILHEVFERPKINNPHLQKTLGLAYEGEKGYTSGGRPFKRVHEEHPIFQERSGSVPIHRPRLAKYRSQNTWKPLKRNSYPIGSRKPERSADQYPQINEIVKDVERKTGLRPKVFRLGSKISESDIPDLINLVNMMDSKPEATNRMGHHGDRGFFSHFLKSIWPGKRRNKKFKEHDRFGTSSIPQDVGIMEIMNRLDTIRRHRSDAIDRRGYGYRHYGPRHHGHYGNPYRYKEFTKGPTSKESSDSSSESVEADTNQDDTGNDGRRTELSTVTIYTFAPETQSDRGRSKPYGSYGQPRNNDPIAQTPSVVVLDSNRGNDNSLDSRDLFSFFRDIFRHRYYHHYPHRYRRRRRKNRSRKPYVKSLKALLLLAPFVKIPLVISLLALLPIGIPLVTGGLPLLGLKRRRKRSASNLNQRNWYQPRDIESINCLQRVLCQSLDQLPNGELRIMERIIRRNPEISENVFVNKAVIYGHLKKCAKFNCRPLEVFQLKI